MIVRYLGGASGILYAHKAFTSVGGGTAAALLDVYLDDVGAFIAYDLVGAAVVIVAAGREEGHFVDTGAEVTAGIGAANRAEHALSG